MAAYWNSIQRMLAGKSGEIVPRKRSRFEPQAFNPQGLTLDSEEVELSAEDVTTRTSDPFDSVAQPAMPPEQSFSQRQKFTKDGESSQPSKHWHEDPMLPSSAEMQTPSGQNDISSTSETRVRETTNPSFFETTSEATHIPVQSPIQNERYNPDYRERQSLSSESLDQEMTPLEIADNLHEPTLANVEPETDLVAIQARLTELSERIEEPVVAQPSHFNALPVSSENDVQLPIVNTAPLVIEIGQIEIDLNPPAQTSSPLMVKAPPSKPVMSLEDYLSLNERGR